MNQPSVRISTVMISESGISELDGDKIVVTIPREQIVEISLGRGTGAEHPIIQLAVSIILITLGLYWGSTALYLAARGGSLISIKTFAYGAPLVFIGGWLLLEVFRQVYFLSIRTEKGTRKMPFERSTGTLEIGQFIIRAMQEFSYHIDSTALKEE